LAITNDRARPKNAPSMRDAEKREESSTNFAWADIVVALFINLTAFRVLD
jgi:hypothetical protein